MFNLNAFRKLFWNPRTISITNFLSLSHQLVTVSTVIRDVTVVLVTFALKHIIVQLVFFEF